LGSTPKVAIPVGRVPAVCTDPPALASVAEIAKYPASVDVQLSVVVLAPAGAGKLPLATALPRLSLTDHASVSAADGLAVITIGNVLPEANMRVPSVLGVSAVMTPLDEEPVAVTGDAQVMRNAALATAEGETTTAGLAAPVEPVVPAAVLAVVPDVVAAVPPEAVPDAPDALAAAPAPPLVAAVELELAGSPDPPPPHAANASTTEHSE